jgi:hypothetical protein
MFSEVDARGNMIGRFFGVGVQSNRVPPQQQGAASTGRLSLPSQQGPSLLVPVGDEPHDTPRGMTWLPDLGIFVPNSNALWKLRSRLRTYPIDEFLNVLAHVTWRKLLDPAAFGQLAHRLGWDPNFAFRDYQLAFLVKVLLENRGWSGVRQWPVQTDVEILQVVQHCAALVGNVIPSADLESRDDVVQDGHAVLMRVAYQQFGDYEALERLLPRAVMLYLDCCQEAEAQQNLRLTSVFREKVGLSIEESLFLTYGLVAVLPKLDGGRFFNEDLLTQSPEFPGLTRERMAAYLAWLSTDYETYVARSEDPRYQNQAGFDLYNFNLLISQPILRNPDGYYVVPIASYLLKRVSSGLFYDLMDTNKSDKVGNIIGRSFEVYVKRLIESMSHHGSVICADNLNLSSKICEYIIEESNHVLLIECKRASLRQEMKTTGNSSAIRDYLDKRHGIVDGLIQLRSTVELIKDGEILGISSDKKVLCLIVTLDPLHFGNDPQIREIMHECGKAKGQSLSDLTYQVASITDFENACMLAEALGVELSSIIQEKTEDAEMVLWDITTWVNKRWPEGKAKKLLPVLHRAIEQFMQRVIEQFRKASPETA